VMNERIVLLDTSE